MVFKDFVNDAVEKGTATNKQPRGRQTTQPGIDEVNRSAALTADNAFEDVASVLAGNSSPRQPRSTDLADLCAALVPPNEVPSPSQTTLAVSISPNSWDDGANIATEPAVQTIPIWTGALGAQYQSVAQYNIGRQRLIIQNIGTGNLYVVFGKATQFNANVTTAYHVKITSGQTYFDDQWQGRVDVASDTGTNISVVEFTRAKNVSQ